MAETPSSDYAERTDWNVRDSDATLILLKDGIPRGGSRLTLQCAKARSKPVHIEYLFPERAACADELLDWLRSYRVEILNVAGPRESEVPGIYEETRTFLRRAFTAIQKGSARTPLSGS